jgi:hypothetical protein
MVKDRQKRQKITVSPAASGLRAMPGLTPQFMGLFFCF